MLIRQGITCRRYTNNFVDILKKIWYFLFNMLSLDGEVLLSVLFRECVVGVNAQDEGKWSLRSRLLEYPVGEYG